MTGGPPWGFRMTGGHDFRQPLAIGKVTPGGKADRAGVAEGHHILTVNGEDVTQLAHLQAQNKIKAAKTTLILELSNAPVPKPTAPEVSVPTYQTPSYTPPPEKSYGNSSSSTKSYIAPNKAPASYNASLSPSHSKSVSLPVRMSAPRSPSAYSVPHQKSPSYEHPPDIEYRAVDSRDSQRRLYEELQDSEYAPTAHQSTLQSPSLQALARSSGYSSSKSDSEPKTLQITEEIRDMILEEEDGRQNGHHQSSYGDAALRPTGVKVYEPQQRYDNKTSPAPYPGPSSADFVQPAAHQHSHSYSNSSQPSTYNSSQTQPTKSKAVGNISKFIQSSGAKQGAPTFAKTLQDLQCPVGDPAVLEIRIGNTLPVPTVAWYHNDRPVRESREKDIKFLNRGIVHTLVLGEFAPEFAGRFRCVLTNRHGSVSCNSFLTVEQHGDNGQYSTSPTYSSNSAPSRGYQPAYTNNYGSSYQPQTQRVSKPPVASNSIGLYSQNTAQAAYKAQTKKRSTSDDPDEESAVMRALREEGQVGDGRSHHQSRSMKMLEENLMPESDDL